MANLTRYFVDEDTGCWVWTGGISSQTGYGMVYVGRRTGRSKGKRPGGMGSAHRASWEATNGPIPDDLHIDHLCGVRSCINPEHLELVTNGENTRRGALAKLSWPIVREIRATPRSVSDRELGRRYGVSHSRIGAVRRRTSWWPEP